MLRGWMFGVAACAIGAGAPLAFASCGGGTQQPSSGNDGGASVSADVGPSGGSVSACNGSISIPAGALSTTTTITVSCDPTATVAGYSLASPLYRFQPDGLTFAIPTTVTVSFEGQPAEPTLFWSRPDGSGYDAIASMVQGAVVVGQVSHFSTGFVAPRPPPDGGADGPSNGPSDAPTDAGSDADGAPICHLPADPPTTGVPCGPGQTCSGSDSSCCYDDLTCGSPNGIRYTDASPNMLCQAVERCDGPEDCPAGQQCFVGPNSYCGTAQLFPTACHADSDCPPDAPLCGPPREIMPLNSSLYVLRTCTRICSSDSDCTVPWSDASLSIYGTCSATSGCASTCGFPAPDAGPDSGPYVPPTDAGCVTPYTPGSVACPNASGAASYCNTEWTVCCGNASCTPGACGTSSGYTTMCDGPEDCADGSVCANGNCLAGSSCDVTLFNLTTVSECNCHSAADCTAKFPYCYPPSRSIVANCQSTPPPPDAGITYGSCTPTSTPPNYAIACGSATCTSLSDDCCMAGTSACQPRDAGCSGLTLQCDGPEDCIPGSVCYLAYNGPRGQAAFCSGLLSGTTSLPSGIVCHTAADCPAFSTSCVPLDAGAPLSLCH
jgi:hypothetical protein